MSNENDGEEIGYTVSVRGMDSEKATTSSLTTAEFVAEAFAKSWPDEVVEIRDVANDSVVATYHGEVVPRTEVTRRAAK